MNSVCDADLRFFLIFAAYCTGLGACIASFLNVCIWRLPRNESVVRPGSHCPHCGAAIRWWQNVPVVSYLALRGRCASCRGPISPRYVIVEALGAVLFLLAYLQWAVPFFLKAPPPAGLTPIGDPTAVAVEFLAITGLILASFIDLDHFYLPDRVTVGGMIVGLPAAYLVPELQGETEPLRALAWSAGGLAFGFGTLWSVGKAFSLLLRKEAMGFGDVKLAGAIGALFGPLAVLFVLIVSSAVGSVAGGAMILRGKAKLGSFAMIPYGPFLALGTLMWMYWGPAAVGAYLRLVGFAG